MIPYEFDSVIQANVDYQRLIYAAMKEWQSATCLRFQPFSKSLGDSLGHQQRLQFVTDQRGCWSYVGRVDENWSLNVVGFQ